MKSMSNLYPPISTVRLIVEAVCPQCGPLTAVPTEGVSAILLAEKHTAETAHVVVLNGTIDLLIPAEWGEA